MWEVGGARGRLMRIPASYKQKDKRTLEGERLREAFPGGEAALKCA